MTNQDMSDQGLEQKLQAYYEAERPRLQAPADLWARIEGKMNRQTTTENRIPLWRKPVSPGRWRPIYAFAVTLVLLIGVSGAWLFTAAPWQGGGASRQEDGTTQLGRIWGLSAALLSRTDTPSPRPAAVPTPTRAPAPRTALTGSAAYDQNTATITSGAAEAKGAPGPTSASVLDTVDRQVISQASMSVEVANVQASVPQVRAIAEGLGGFVEQLSFSGGAEKQQATITIRVPQPDFFTALERIQALGTVQSQSLGSQDVTEQFIDLKARLESAQREELSLLNLLGKATSVSDILTIERELSRVRSDLERFQGQLNFMERRVDLATLTVSLFPPEAKQTQPPSGNLTVVVPDVSGSVARVRSLVAGKGEIDQVYLSVQIGKERAELTLRVFSKEFGGVLASVEGLGKVKSKEVREGATGDADAKPSEKPDAYLAVSLVEEESSLVRRIIVIGAPIAGVVLVALLAYLFYRAGRRRGLAAKT
ncbi:MAG: DUF4349 domain-containing protein [Chloroflexi bacterium]|nr:DUF4349 domain-containing protein [Chloroflexota bacterium]